MVTFDGSSSPTYRREQHTHFESKLTVLITRKQGVRTFPRNQIELWYVMASSNRNGHAGIWLFNCELALLKNGSELKFYFVFKQQEVSISVRDLYIA